MQASPLQCNLNFYDLCTTQKHWHIVSFMMEKCNILGISIIKLVLGRLSGWIIPSILPVPYRKIKHTTKVSRWSRILHSISFSKNCTYLAHLIAQREQSGHSESMMEGKGTRTVAWTQEKKDFTDLPLGRVKESPAALGHQTKNAASSNLPSKKQSIVRDYVSIMLQKYLFPFSAWRSTSLPHLQEGAGRFVQKTLQKKWGMAKQWERCTLQMDDNDSLTMVPMLEDTRLMWMHPNPKHINICCICCKATEISKIFLPQTHIEHVKHLFSGTWWQQTRSAAHWDQAAHHRTSAQQPRRTARQWVKGSSQEWRTIADKCAFPFWNLSIAFPLKLPVHEQIHAPWYLWSIHPNRMWFSLIFICSCLLDFEVLDGHSEFWMKSRDWKCICYTSPSNEGWCPNFKFDLNGSHHKMHPRCKQLPSSDGSASIMALRQRPNLSKSIRNTYSHRRAYEYAISWYSLFGQ